MNTSDCLLWVGHRYTIPKFIEEAQGRGCCRKVPQAPRWLKPGKSRVFLAHQDGLAPQHGVIFGYFVLGGVDVVDGKMHEDGEYLSMETLETLLSCGGGAGEPLTIPRFRALLEGRRLCGLRSKESHGDSLQNPAIYLVDALTRDVDKIFCTLIKALIEEELQLSGSPHKVSAKNLKDKAMSRQLFEEAVRLAQELPRTAPEVPGILKGRAEAHGPLVLFDQPYPVFHRFPQAAFRGLIAIDGDQLIEEVTETYRPQRQENLGAWRSRWILIPYAQDPEEKLTQAVLVEALAHECQTNKEMAHAFLKAFEDIVGSRLKKNGKVPLAGFGTFLARQRPERKGKHPATGQDMLLPPTTSIQFRPAERLRARVL